MATKTNSLDFQLFSFSRNQWITPFPSIIHKSKFKKSTFGPNYACISVENGFVRCIFGIRWAQIWPVWGTESGKTRKAMIPSRFVLSDRYRRRPWECLHESLYLSAAFRILSEWGVGLVVRINPEKWNLIFSVCRSAEVFVSQISQWWPTWSP